MKKILIIILIILLSCFAYYAIVEGFSIKEIRILSIKDIKEKNDKITTEIKEVEALKNSSYLKKQEELKESVDRMEKEKEQYLDLASVSTEGELSKANKEETYKQQFLWTKIGRYATQEGVKLTFSITSGNTGNILDKNLLFDVSGSYFAIVNFISAIEDDNELNFRIEDFKMIPGTDQNSRRATFKAKNVRIEQDNIQSPFENGTTNIEPDMNKETLKENTSEIETKNNQ